MVKVPYRIARKGTPFPTSGLALSRRFVFSLQIVGVRRFVSRPFRNLVFRTRRILKLLGLWLGLVLVLGLGG